MLEVVIALIVVILILALVCRNIKLKGGYKIPDSFLLASNSEIHDRLSAVRKFDNLGKKKMDDYCKSIAYYFFSHKGRLPKNIKYVEAPEPLVEIDDGKQVITNTLEIAPYIGKRIIPHNKTTFIPDFIMSNEEGTYRILIVEFDEDDSYHQRNDISYIMKNYIYDEILCKSYREKINICVLRIKYDETKDGLSICDKHKELGVRYIASIILFTWKHMNYRYGNEYFHNQYILASLNVEDELTIKEFISLKAADDNTLNTFTIRKPLFSCFNLDNRELIPGFKDTRRKEDLEYEDILDLLKDEAFDHYEVSGYKEFFERKKIGDGNSLDNAIDRFAEVDDLTFKF